MNLHSTASRVSAPAAGPGSKWSLLGWTFLGLVIACAVGGIVVTGAVESMSSAGMGGCNQPSYPNWVGALQLLLLGVAATNLAVWIAWLASSLRRRPGHTRSARITTSMLGGMVGLPVTVGGAGAAALATLMSGWCF